MKNKLSVLLLGIFSLTFARANAVADVNQKIMGFFTGISGKSVINVVGWILVIALLIGGAWWYLKYSKNKKIFNKRITAFEIIGDYWEPVLRDVAKTVKLGKGGFEILFLKKLKTWKIAYGGRVGKSDYYFFIMPDGYWYNGKLVAGVNEITERGGLIPVGTTNPLMRGQYTALEKQIDSLHGDKIKWWDKYGSYVLSIAFILISGVLMWLMFKEWRGAVGELANYHSQMKSILDSLANLASNINQGSGGSGLVPA
jgi:TM2 domain-containing membrane protein YozV